MVTTRTRWLVLLILLGLTLFAMWFPYEPEVLSPVDRADRKDVAVTQKNPAQFAFAELVDLKQEDDPFLPRVWVASEEPMKKTEIVSAPVVKQVDVLPQDLPTPPLPYKYLGKFDDDAELLVYLARGENTLVVKLGEVVEGQYKVTAISEKSIDFVYLPKNEKQSLLIE